MKIICWINENKFLTAFVIFLAVLLLCIIGCQEKEYNPYIPGVYTESDMQDRFSLGKLMSQDPMALSPVLTAPDGRLYGDIDKSGELNIIDLTRLISIVKASSMPPEWKAEVNGDCKINWDDVWYFADYMFAGGPPPQKPCKVPK